MKAKRKIIIITILQFIHLKGKPELIKYKEKVGLMAKTVQKLLDIVDHDYILF